ncbi:hypothetical protein CR513_38793, partial [Mucuna pruriens]
MVQQMIISAFFALEFSESLNCSRATRKSWYFDSGASNYLTSNAQFLTNINRYYGHLMIHTANGN